MDRGAHGQRTVGAPIGPGPVGFHLRHIGHSADRLTTYLKGGQLDDGQTAGLKSEKAAGADLFAGCRSQQSRYSSAAAGTPGTILPPELDKYEGLKLAGVPAHPSVIDPI